MTALNNLQNNLMIGARVGLVTGGVQALWDSMLSPIVRPFAMALPPQVTAPLFSGSQTPTLASFIKGFASGFLATLFVRYTDMFYFVQAF